MTDTALQEAGMMPFLSYPAGTVYDKEKTLQELTSLGVTHISLSGPTLVLGRRLLGKGKSSLVFECVWRGRTAVVKVMRSDSPVSSFEFEAHILARANDNGVGPTLLAHSERAMVMTRAGGVHLVEWLKRKDVRRFRPTITRILRQARNLDLAGIRHNELSNPAKHILVYRGRPTILDFGGATYGSRGHNVAAVSQYLVLRNRQPSGESIDPAFSQFIRAAKAYRSRPSDTEFEVILRSTMAALEALQTRPESNYSSRLGGCA